MLPFQQVRFRLSAGDFAQFPPDEGREVAFVGRSNAGKSSAINALTGRRALARISKTPGRTQQINFFDIDADRRLVDLPGYGYAKVPRAMKRHWERLIERYLQRRRSLRGLVVVVDCRRGLSELDRMLLAWCRAAGIPAHVLLTKADKLSRGAASAVLLQTRKALAEEFPGSEEAQLGAQLFSALKKSGVEALQARLADWLGDAASAENGQKKAPVIKEGGITGAK
ncbi:MAG TPA: YihA family ribosome biogenesis GTP-binding protein [Gammaproteobacteria bacterium]|nr:YihA family ribosome biogenesis GTP-binding protein [Gammaproteobacteria bacterium]